MSLRHTLVVAAIGVLAVLATPDPGVAAVQEPLGTDCATQIENDARVRALFGPLTKRFVTHVGKPVGCLATAPDGGVTQQTTTGLLYARNEDGGRVRIIVFTDGHRHWAVDANLSRVTLYWEGDRPYPPAQGVTRIPLAAADALSEAPWPPSPVPTVGATTPMPASANRPATGEHLAESTYAGGRSVLTLANSTPADAAFKVRDADGARGTRAFVYVRSGEEARLENVRPGTYELQGIAGLDWDADTGIFRRGLRAFKADTQLEFVETQDADGIRWINRTFIIRPVAGETDTGMSTLNLEEFQKD